MMVRFLYSVKGVCTCTCDWIECLVSSMHVRRCTSVYIFFCQIVIYQFPSIMSRCFPSKKTWHPYTDTQALKHTQTHTSLLLFTLQNLTAWYYCHANLRRLFSTNAILFVLYSDSHSAHFGNIEKESGWRATGGEGCWQNRPQMPQMGFQSVLIYLSPWGLRSVVICLCLGWHDRCPSCFRLCSHRSFHAYRIIHSSVNSLRLFLFLGRDLENEEK